ncbi:S-layer homology domain-containing protein [Sporomusa acidovorans]|uniref:SLH domain-containing protein n=1 Tax=Sporomusa acidovorans (strain ATCC 49682 / DSM 3132 / Mol) TaxID=1123286 RepID=A0ABZ3J7U7_SPOA4|nr:porin [Sporomusa acidovorans]OZC19314.1 outer membrane protein alpha precursor [Sporomusa acidovorans DSM 3132]SDD81090.1 Capsule assembly protein Wzi [Sporomusa acidovorans]
MKRQTAMALAAVFAMSVAGTALAAPANPFVDVPAKHWSYDSVNQLVKAGVISGYGDGTYKGDKTLTRYEMATIVAKAMANSDKADAQMKKNIEALKAEYGAELNNLGVRVDNLEKNASKVKFTGEVRSRYDWQDKKDGQTFDNTDERTRLRLYMEAPIDPNVTFHGRYQAESGWGTGAESKLDQAYITGKLGGLEYSFGRQPVWLGQGMIADVSDSNDGLFLTAGKDVKVTVGAFKRDVAGYATAKDWGFDLTDPDDLTDWNNLKNSVEKNFYAANIDAKLNKNLNLSLSYLADKESNIYKTTSAGLNYTGLKNFTISGEYGQNDSDALQGEKAKAWMGKIKYAGAQKDKVGSLGVWAGYRSAEVGFDPAELTTLDCGRRLDTSYGILDNVKGPEFGIEYTVFRNGILTIQYNDLELKDVIATTGNGTNKDKKSLFAQLVYTF